jgi:DNA-directed RNA polymerase subunit alpha
METASHEVLSRPVSSLELSVRARKCLQRLGIATVGELASKSENELLESRNFGTTSLREIKNQLSELGLTLRASA